MNMNLMYLTEPATNNESIFGCHSRGMQFGGKLNGIINFVIFIVLLPGYIMEMVPSFGLGYKALITIAIQLSPPTGTWAKINTSSEITPVK